jgi:signal transduction histidine kinase
MARIAFSIMKGYNKNDVEVFETFLYHKNGTPIDVEVAGKVIFNKKGMPSHILGSTRVITERKKAEKELKEITKKLRESNATKDKFFSIVAHDLKNPFNALMGFSDLLEQEAKKTDNEKIKTYSSLISTTLSKSLDYLNNLLEWSRLQSDKIEFQPVQVNLLQLVRETVEILNVQSESKNISIKIDLPNDISIKADENMLKTVLLNLISNAIKYSYPDSSIILKGKREKGKVSFSVKDNGVGIKSEAREKLFLIEEASSTRGTNNEAGTGLGLILCKEFIMKHHGEIGAKSKYGKGSTFWFKIPEI